jgi:hypothetical protein
LIGTTSKKLCFGGKHYAPKGYVDSDLVVDIDSKRSTTRYVFTIGVTPVSWISRLQKVVALSTTKVEYVATIETNK